MFGRIDDGRIRRERKNGDSVKKKRKKKKEARETIPVVPVYSEV